MGDESMMKVCREAARDRPALQHQCGQKHPPCHPFSIPAIVPPAASWAKGILSSPTRAPLTAALPNQDHPAEERL